jgi:hypothetical protein
LEAEFADGHVAGSIPLDLMSLTDPALRGRLSLAERYEDFHAYP